MKKSKDIAYLRQICCSGFDKEIFVPEFLRAVQTIIPSSNNAFSGVSQELLPNYFLEEYVNTELVDVLPMIMSGFWTPERTNRFITWFDNHQVLTDQKVVDESFYNTDLYNLIFRPYARHHCLYAPVMQSGKMLGVLALYRPGNQKPFSSADQNLITTLTPYVAHALQSSENHEVQYGVTNSSGMMIWDTQGGLLFLCEEARKLMILASYPLFTTESSGKDEGLYAKLTLLCRNLEAGFQGKSAPPPSIRHINGRGCFLFRAYWLNKYDQKPGSFIGMTIEHQEPFSLKVLRLLKNVPLSPMQKEVALLLVQGASNEKIGERLFIKLTTVKDHIRKIYTKLDINRREELLPKLLKFEN